VMRLANQRLLEGLDRRLEVPLTIAIDETQRVPEVELEIGIALIHHTEEHLPIGSLEVLPIFALRQNAVDGLEALELRRIKIEREVESLERKIKILQRVTRDNGRRIVVTRLDGVAIVELGDSIDRVDDLVPVANGLVDLEELMKRAEIVRTNI